MRSLDQLKAIMTDDQLIKTASMIKLYGNLVATRHLESLGFTLQESRELTNHIAEFLATWRRS